MTKHGVTGKRWFWLRDLVLPAGQAASETIPLYVLVALIGSNAPQTLALPYILLAGLVAAGACLTRLTDLLPVAHPVGRVALGMLTVIGLVFAVHAMLAPGAGWDPHTTLMVVTRPWLIDPTRDGQLLFSAWFLSICLWSRGLWIGLETISAQQEIRWFIGGVIILLAVAAVITASPPPGHGGQDGFLRMTILCYFFVGLLVLALAHATTLRRADSPAPGASFSWLLAIALPVVAIPLTGVIFTFGVGPALRLLMRFCIMLSIIGWHILLWIGYWLLLFLRWLSSLFPAAKQIPPDQEGCLRPPEWLVHFRHWLSRWFGSGGGESALSQQGCTRAPPPIQIPAVQSHVPVSNSDATAVVVVFVAGLLVALLFYLLMRRRANVDALDPDDERSSAWSWTLFTSQLGALWDAVLGRWRAWLRPHGDAPATGPATQHISAEGDIRGLYRRFLRRAEGLHHRRAPADTPLEFARSLERAGVGRREDIAVVSDAYDQARYGNKILNATTLVDVRQAVARFEGTITETTPAAKHGD